MTQVFAYWQQRDRSPISAFTEHWRASFPSFRIYGDHQVLPLLQRLYPHAVELYADLSIPAARADIARLLLLHAHGGMYIGSHLGMDAVAPLTSALELLDRYEGVLVERSPRLPGLRGEQRSFVNMVMLAVAGSEWLLDVCQAALANLERQRAAERAGPAPYDIWWLTGPGLLTSIVLDNGLSDLRPAYAGSIAVRSEAQLGLRRNAFPPETGQSHWSVRQQSEPLFLPS